MQFYERYEILLRQALTDLSILAGDEGGSGASWQDVAGTASCNLQALSALLEGARAGTPRMGAHLLGGPISFASPKEILDPLGDHPPFRHCKSYAAGIEQDVGQYAMMYGPSEDLEELLYDIESCEGDTMPDRMTVVEFDPRGPLGQEGESRAIKFWNPEKGDWDDAPEHQS